MCLAGEHVEGDEEQGGLAGGAVLYVGDAGLAVLVAGYALVDPEHEVFGTGETLVAFPAVAGLAGEVAAVLVDGVGAAEHVGDGGGAGVALDLGDAAAGGAGLVAGQAQARLRDARVHHLLGVYAGRALIKVSAGTGVAVHVAADIIVWRQELKLLSEEAREAVGGRDDTGLAVGIARGARSLHWRSRGAHHEISARTARNAEILSRSAAGGAVHMAAVAVVQELVGIAGGALVPVRPGTVPAVGMAGLALIYVQISPFDARRTGVEGLLGAGLAMRMAANAYEGSSAVRAGHAFVEARLGAR